MLFLASEVAPFAKTGGLADVAAALPKALKALGIDVRVVLPLYGEIDRRRFGLRRTGIRIHVGEGPAARSGTVWESVLPGSAVPVYFLEQAAWFDRPGLYQAHGQDHPDNLRRFGFFAFASLRLPSAWGWRPHLIHAHDWQAALACAHLAFGPVAREPELAGVRSVLTIHNLAFQGVFPRAQWPATHLPDDAFHINGLEYYGHLNCLKGGLVSAARLTTVSPTYAQEIQTPAFGCGLDGVIRSRAQALEGILNGIDTEEWNPATDPHLPSRYSAASPDGKKACRRALRQELGLADSPGLVIGMVQRLTDQKGVDLALKALPELMRLPVQVALLGTGEPAYHEKWRAAAARHPGRVAVRLAFDDALAHRIEAGADVFLMPSRFEPCGLNQMYSMRYGTVPIVRRVGGLADTVVDAGRGARLARGATGFVFEAATATALTEAVRRAAEAFRRPAAWAALRLAGMRRDFSWTHSARAYLRVYETVLADARPKRRHVSTP